MKTKSTNLLGASSLRWRVIISTGMINLGLLAIFPNCSTAPMPDLAPGPGKVVGSVVGGVFFAPGIIGRGISRIVDHKNEVSTKKAILQRKSYSESEWNRSGLWEKIKVTPATFVPRGYGKIAKYDYDQGTWLVDPTDGKRLFAPNQSWANHDSDFWMEEARIIVSHLWQPAGSPTAVPNKKQP